MAESICATQLAALGEPSPRMDTYSKYSAATWVSACFGNDCCGYIYLEHPHRLGVISHLQPQLGITSTTQRKASGCVKCAPCLASVASRPDNIIFDHSSGSSIIYVSLHMLLELKPTSLSELQRTTYVYM